MRFTSNFSAEPEGDAADNEDRDGGIQRFTHPRFTLLDTHSSALPAPPPAPSAPTPPPLAAQLRERFYTDETDDKELADFATLSIFFCGVAATTLQMSTSQGSGTGALGAVVNALFLAAVLCSSSAAVYPMIAGQKWRQHRHVNIFNAHRLEEH